MQLFSNMKLYITYSSSASFFFNRNFVLISQLLCILEMISTFSSLEKILLMNSYFLRVYLSILLITDLTLKSRLIKFSIKLITLIF